MIKNKGDSVVVGTVRNVHNLLSYGVLGKLHFSFSMTE